MTAARVRQHPSSVGTATVAVTSPPKEVKWRTRTNVHTSAFSVFRYVLEVEPIDRFTRASMRTLVGRRPPTLALVVERRLLDPRTRTPRDAAFHHRGLRSHRIRANGPAISAAHQTSSSTTVSMTVIVRASTESADALLNGLIADCAQRYAVEHVRVDERFEPLTGFVVD